MSQRQTVPPLSVVIDEVHHTFVRAKVFKSGSVGWYASEKMELGGERCQVSICVTVIGSKKKGGTKSVVGQELEATSENAQDGQNRTLLPDGSELVEVVPEAPNEPYANRKRSWKK